MKIVTAVVNNPIFIEIQYFTLLKHFKGSHYEFIVFNDAKDFPDFTNDNDITIKKQIEDVCEKLKIKCINIPNEKHKTNLSPCDRAADSMNYILSYQKNNPDKYLLIDSDMFLVDDFNINKYFNFKCAVILNSRNYNKINYIWNGIYYFDMTKMTDIELLNWNLSEGCDVGGMMQKWLKKQMGNIPFPNVYELRYGPYTYVINDIYFMKHLWSCTWNLIDMPENLRKNEKLVHFLVNDVRNTKSHFFCEIYDNAFLHYRAGGNWRKEGLDLHNDLSKILRSCLVD